jgi:hypothetical protein
MTLRSADSRAAGPLASIDGNLRTLRWAATQTVFRPLGFVPFSAVFKTTPRSQKPFPFEGWGFDSPLGTTISGSLVGRPPTHFRARVVGSDSLIAKSALAANRLDRGFHPGTYRSLTARAAPLLNCNINAGKGGGGDGLRL